MEAEAFAKMKASMLSAVEDACKHMELCAETYTARQEVRLKEPLDKSRAEVKSLKKEVASLKSDLARSRATRIEPAVGSAGQRPQDRLSGMDARPGTDSDATAAAAEISRMRHDMEKLRSRYDAVRKQLDSAVALAQKRKAETLSWVTYADSLELKIRKLEKKTARNQAQPATGDSVIRPAVADAVPAEPVTEEHAPPPQPTAKAASEPPGEAEGRLSRPSFSASFGASSTSFEAGDHGHAEDASHRSEPNPDSTQGDPSDDGTEPQLPALPITGPEIQDAVRIKNEPSSDGPEVVWERPVKRPRRDNSEEGAQMATPPANAVVKREPIDTPRYLGLDESLDLDEGQLVMPTPRKRQLVYHDFSSPEASEGDGTTTPEPSGGRNVLQTPLTSVLTPLPVNVQRPVAAASEKSTHKPSRSAKLLKRGVDSLAEDCEQMRPPSTAKPARLQSLLNSRPPQPSPILPVQRTAAEPVHTSPMSGVSGAFGEPPPMRTLPPRRDAGGPSGPLGSSGGTAAWMPKGREASRPTETALTAALKAAATKHASKKASLRGKPIGQLKLDDFKINPAANGGEAFAFHEVVRSRTDRGNLDGCTDPQCCGKAFRSMAESELTAAGPGHMGRPDSVAMMERYLGDDAFVLGRMSPGEKKELWLEAKTKQLADKYGKHRHRYHRRASPPGFWDTDFPTTQEEEHNRAESARVERAAVQERYREAMRPGGRWLFRDE